MRKQQKNRLASYIVIAFFGAAGLLLGGLCTLSGMLTAETSAEFQLAITAVGCLAIPGVAIVAGVILAWYRDKLNKEYEAYSQALESAKVQELEELKRDRWLQTLDDPPWDKTTCEVEMESKFIYPLLKYLGYDDRDMRMRVKVGVQEGRLDTTIEADWMLVNGEDHIAVIEAKAPRIRLHKRVIEQAKSYAIRLNAPVYIITNGFDIAVYHREVIGERKVFHGKAGGLHRTWDEFYAVASKETVLQIHARLKNNLDHASEA
ncbi:hypothetical protein GF348_02940 [candidate division KSB3 bacterium]|nr:hypothetical protein [candidate division KSB3 bacterium]